MSLEEAITNLTLELREANALARENLNLRKQLAGDPEQPLPPAPEPEKKQRKKVTQEAPVSEPTAPQTTPVVEETTPAVEPEPETPVVAETETPVTAEDIRAYCRPFLTGQEGKDRVRALLAPLYEKYSTEKNTVKSAADLSPDQRAPFLTELKEVLK